MEVLPEHPSLFQLYVKRQGYIGRKQFFNEISKRLLRQIWRK